MPQGVPVVETFSSHVITMRGLLVRVGSHHRRLDTHRCLEHGAKLLAAGVEHCLWCGADAFEDARIGNETALDDLGESGAHLSPVEAAQQVGVAQYGQRLVERSDEILPGHQIDPRLAADGGVRHGQYRRR